MIRAVKHTYHFLVALLSLIWFRFPGNRLTVIGVTGTDGKTTTTTLIYEILKNAGYKTSMITSVHAVIGGKAYDTGFHVTTPNAFYVQKYLREAVDHKDTHVVLEVTSHALDQYRVYGVPFAVGVITNVTHEHLDWHKTLDQYLKTKLSLLTHARVAVVNMDDEHLYAEIRKKVTHADIRTYSMKGQADITPTIFPFQTTLPGIFNQYNCLAAIGAAQAVSVPPASIRKTLSVFQGIPGRMEIVYKKDFTVMVDFAHTPNALRQALSTVRPMTKGRLIHVFGSAGLRDPMKRPMMGEASAEYADIIILTEEDYRTEDREVIMDEIQSGIPGRKDVRRFPDRRDAIHAALTMAKKGDFVICTGKGHEKSLCRGTKEYPWSDQEEIKKSLTSLKKIHG